MKNIFFILLFLVLFEFEAKTKEIPIEKLEKVLELIYNIKDIGKWNDLILVLNTYGKDIGIGWCTKFAEKKICEILSISSSLESGSKKFKSKLLKAVSKMIADDDSDDSDDSDD